MQKITLVTGASRGFGHAAALALAKRGDHVLAFARTQGALEELDDQIQAAGGAATLIPADITDEAGLQRMGRAIHDRWGRLDLVVHAAAHAPPQAPTDTLSVKDLDRSFAVNARATQRLIAMTAPLLRAAEGGHFVHITDSRAGAKFFGAYGASKAAAASIVATFAAETAQIGPKVTLHEPPPMPTALRARFFPGEDRSTLTTPTKAADALLQALE